MTPAGAARTGKSGESKVANTMLRMKATLREPAVGAMRNATFDSANNSALATAHPIALAAGA
jgi:hypothetical protein